MPKGAAAALVAMVVASSYACGSGSGPEVEAQPPTPVPTPTPIDPAVLLQRMGAAMEDVSSFEFLLDHESGGTVIMPNIVMTEIEGQVIRPDRLSVGFKGRFGNFAIRGRLVTVGDTTYMTNPLTDEWEEIPPDISPVRFFNEFADMVSQVIPSGATLDGDLFRVKGRLPTEALEPLVGSTIKGETVAIELAASTSNAHIVEVTFDGAVTEAEEAGTIRRITLSRFNESFSIELPE